MLKASVYVYDFKMNIPFSLKPVQDNKGLLKCDSDRKPITGVVRRL